MDAIDVPPVPLDAWLAVIEREYLRDFLPAGGGGVKFAVADTVVLERLPAAVAAMATRHRFLPVSVSAGEARLHMLQDVFFAIARALPWDSLLQRYLEDLFTRHGYTWPRPGAPMTMADLAAAFDVAPNLLARSRDQWLSRDLWEDARLAQDFRGAMLHLCLARLEPESADADVATPVMAWLRGEKVPLALLRQNEIAARIGRTNARPMLVSLCHWLRKCGTPGLLLTLDLRPALRPAACQNVRYSAAAVMDLYEVLREIIDDAEHLPGLFVLAIADQALIAGDRRRTLDSYKALEMRIWPDVHPGKGQNPLAPLVTVGP
jgi:P-loop Domain of unknown function (DUF2791)